MSSMNANVKRWIDVKHNCLFVVNEDEREEANMCHDGIRTGEVVILFMIT